MISFVLNLIALVAGYFIPTCFMTAVSVPYLCIAETGFNMPIGWNWEIGAIVLVLSLSLFYFWKIKKINNNNYVR